MVISSGARLPNQLCTAWVTRGTCMTTHSTKNQSAAAIGRAPARATQRAGLRLLLSLTSLLLVAACGSGSGAGTSENPVTSTPDVSNYSGPAPATADVQAFKLAMWDNLVPNNRCGSCHNDSQDPRFVRADDINLAYAVANDIVDLTSPGDSLMVQKVRGGHNCAPRWMFYICS